MFKACRGQSFQIRKQFEQLVLVGVNWSACFVFFQFLKILLTIERVIYFVRIESLFNLVNRKEISLLNLLLIHKRARVHHASVIMVSN